MDNILKKIEYGSNGHTIILKAIESELLFNYIKQLIRNEIVTDKLQQWLINFSEEHLNDTGFYSSWLKPKEIMDKLKELKENK